MVEKKLKRIFNENVLKKLKEKEIKSLPKKEKETTKYYETLIKNLNNKITDKENKIKKRKNLKKIQEKILMILMMTLSLSF